MTIVMVTHERALAERYAKRMIFLADGKLIDDQTNPAAITAGVRRGTAMKTYDLTELALRNLRESSLRNSLTTDWYLGRSSLAGRHALARYRPAKVGYPAPGQLRPF